MDAFDALAETATEAAEEARRRRGNGHATEAEWPEPEPLSDPADEPAPFPLDALPELARAAVAEYQAYGQQPVALVAGSAISTMSLAAQGLADVRRDAALCGPLSTNTVVVAESGERKTAADLMFRKAVEDWAKAELQRIAPMLEEYKAALAAFEAEMAGIQNALRAERAKKPKADRDANLDALRKELKELAATRPVAPPRPVPFIEDATPEGLARDLREVWPSSSWWSNEGGAIIGGHGFSEATVVRTLALVNKQWDGQPLDRSRALEGRTRVYGRRLTVSLMLQPVAFGLLVSGNGGIARGLGTLARFLPMWPRSTMGERVYRPPADLDLARAFPALARFQARTVELLKLPLPMAYDTTSFTVTDEGVDPLELHPVEMNLSAPARAVWIAYLNEVERELAPEGDYATVRDVAAKSAENAARLAGIFHVFAHGAQGTIGVDDMERGAVLAGWFLHEARRMLSGAGVAGDGEEAGDAAILARWLRRQERPPTLKEVSQLAPYRVRRKERRDRAIEFLVVKGWARVETREGRSTLVLNPKLEGGA